MAKKSLNIFIGINDKNFTKGLNRVSKKLKKFGGKMKSFGANMTRNVTMPLAGIGVASIKLATDFQTSLTKISTLVGASAEELKTYESAIKTLSVQTGTSATEMAEGLFFITSAGFSGQEALDALEVSAKGAALGMGEMSSVSNSLTSIMTAYASEGMTASKAGDLLHETLKQGKFEAGQFMDKLGSVIPTAAAAGISFEELGAASATMSKLSGDAAGTLTSMKSLMSALLTPSEKQKEILAGIGLSTEDLAKMMDESLLGTMQHLHENLKDNNEAFMNVFGSSKAVTGALSTISLQGETYAKVLDGMNQSQGNVDEGMNTLNQTAGQKFKQSLVKLQNVGIEIGQKLLPPLIKVIEFVMKGVDAFMNMSSESKALTVGIAAIVGAIGPLMTIFGTLTTVLGAILSPVGLLVAALVGAGIMIYKNWEPFKKLLVDFINYFIDLYNESIAFRGIVESIAFVFKTLFATVKFFFSAGIAMVKGFAQNFTDIFGGIGDIIKGVFTWDDDLLKKGLEDARAALADSFTPDKNPELKKATDELAKSTAENFKTAYDNTKKGNKIEFIDEDDVQNVVDKASEIANNVKGKIQSMFAGSGAVVGGSGGGDGGSGSGGSGGGSGGSGGSGGGSDDEPKDWDKWVANAESAMNKYKGIADQIMSITNQIFANEREKINQDTEMKLAKLEEDRLLEEEKINNSTMSEEAKNNALSKIQEDYGKKQTEIKEAADKKQRILARKQAIQDKIAAALQVAVSTASAIMKAVAASPLTGGLPFSAIAGTLGAIQIGAIAAAPLPKLAQGGLAFGETAAIVGDNPNAGADPEVIAPLSKLRSMMGGQEVIVRGQIMGEDIYLSNMRYTKRLNSI